MLPKQQRNDLEQPQSHDNNYDNIEQWEQTNKTLVNDETNAAQMRKAMQKAIKNLK